MERRLLNPKIDFVFKKIFGSEKHPGVLISFLNAVLKPKNNITDVEIKNTDINPFQIPQTNLIPCHLYTFLHLPIHKNSLYPMLFP